MEIVPENETPQAKEPTGFEFSYEAFGPQKMGIFWGALQKVYTCKSFGNFKSAYRIKRLCEAIQAEMKNFQQLMKEVSEIEDKEEQEKKSKELCDLKVHIKWDPLTAAELEAIPGLSPADIDGLEFIAHPSCFQ